MKEKIFFAKTNSSATIPSKLEENAGYDIYANFDEDYIIIPPHKTKMIPIGIASACSPEFYFQLQERGSTGTIGVAQRCGVIDSGYRKEWFAPITNTTDKLLFITKLYDKTTEDDHNIFYPYSKAIAQVVLLPVPKTEVVEMDYEELKKIESIRGMGCLGSSNK